MVEETSLVQTGDAAKAEEAAPPIHLPSPSLWPAALGLGVALVFFGFLTSWAFSVFGAALFAYALVRWVGELRRDASEDHHTEHVETEHVETEHT
jgi:hypothetical protein